MRAVVLGSVPVSIAAMFYRGPASGLAVIVKTALPVDSTQVGATFCAPDLREGVDILPRKSNVDIVVLGDAVSAEATREVLVELQFGRSIHKQLAAPVTSPPWLRGVVPELGPVPLSLATSAAITPAELGLSSVWFDVTLEGDQIAPNDQQTTDELSAGVTLSTFNLARPGRANVRIPSFVPFCLVVDGGKVAGSPRIALRGDTVLVDANNGLVELSYRGEVVIDRITSTSIIVCGLLPRGALPDVASIEETLRTTTPIEVPSFPLEAPAPASHRTQRLARSPAFDLIMSATAAPSSANVRGWTLSGLLATEPDSAVHHATNKRGERGWLTLMNEEASRDPARVMRMKRLLDARRKIDPLKLTPILERGENEHGQPFWVDARPPGESLGELIATKHAWDHPSALAIFRGIARALSAVHRRGLVFGSLSASDVYVDRDRVTLKPSRGWRERDEPDTTGGTESDPRYASPELLRADGSEVTEASDVWSAAAILVELVSGKPLNSFWRGVGWPVPSVVTFLRGLPPHVHEVLDACLSIDAAERPDDGASLFEELSKEPLPQASAEGTAVLDVPGAAPAVPFAPAGFEPTATGRETLSFSPEPALRSGLPFGASPKTLPPLDPDAAAGVEEDFESEHETLPPMSEPADGLPTARPPKPSDSDLGTLPPPPVATRTLPPPAALIPQETLPELALSQGALPFMGRTSTELKTVPPPVGPWATGDFFVPLPPAIPVTISQQRVVIPIDETTHSASRVVVGIAFDVLALALTGDRRDKALRSADLTEVDLQVDGKTTLAEIDTAIAEDDLGPLHDLLSALHNASHVMP